MKKKNVSVVSKENDARRMRTRAEEKAGNGAVDATQRMSTRSKGIRRKNLPHTKACPCCLPEEPKKFDTKKSSLAKAVTLTNPKPADLGKKRKALNLVKQPPKLDSRSSVPQNNVDMVSPQVRSRCTRGKKQRPTAQATTARKVHNRMKQADGLSIRAKLRKRPLSGTAVSVRPPKKAKINGTPEPAVPKPGRLKPALNNRVKIPSVKSAGQKPAVLTKAKKSGTKAPVRSSLSVLKTALRTQSRKSERIKVKTKGSVTSSGPRTLPKPKSAPVESGKSTTKLPRKAVTRTPQPKSSSRKVPVKVELSKTKCPQEKAVVKSKKATPDGKKRKNAEPEKPVTLKKIKKETAKVANSMKIPTKVTKSIEMLAHEASKVENIGGEIRNDSVVGPADAGVKRRKPKAKRAVSGVTEGPVNDFVGCGTASQLKLFSRTLRKLFTDAQVVTKVGKSLESMRQLYIGEEGLFFGQFCRLVHHVLQGDEKNPFTRRLMDFVAEFVVKVTKGEASTRPCVPSSPPISCDAGLESTKEGSRLTFIDRFLDMCIYRSLNSAKVNMRINACLLTKRLLENVESVDANVFENLKKALVERIADKNTNVRLAAAQSLHWCQEAMDPTDVAVNCLKFHLKNDPVPDVRLAVLHSIVPSSVTIVDIIEKVRDVKSTIRKAAVLILAEQVDVKMLTIAQRIGILKATLNEKNSIVRSAVEDRLVLGWLRQYDEDIVEFLVSLDIPSDTATADAVVKVILKRFAAQKLDKTCKLTKYCEKFSEEFLDHRKLLTKSPLTVERSFLWRSLVSFCKEELRRTSLCNDKADEVSKDQELYETADEELSIQLDDVVAEEQIEEPEKKESVVPLHQIVTPQLSHLCGYIKKFIKRVEQSNPSPEELLDMEFMYKQVMEIVLTHRIVERQKPLVLDMCDAVIFSKSLINKFHDYILPLMKFLATSVFDDPSDLLEFTANLTNKVYNSIEESALNGAASPRSESGSSDYEILCVRLGLQIDEHRAQLRTAVRNKDTALAEEIKSKLDEMVQRLASLKKRRTSVDSDHQGPSQATATGSQLLNDNPSILLKCLQIFVGCLKYGDIRELNDTIQSHIDKIVVPGILHPDHRVRTFAVEALGLCCYMNVPLVQKYLALFIQILAHDVEVVRVAALRSLFDFLCQHGLEVLINKDHMLISEGEQSTHEDRRSSTEEPTGPCVASSDGSSGQTGKPDTDLEIALKEASDLVVSLLNVQLDSDRSEIRYITVQGAAKLMLLGHLRSPALLSKMIVVGSSSNAKTELEYLLRTFLPVYAYSQGKSSDDGQGNVLEECFVPTIEVGVKMNQKKSDEEKEQESPLSDDESNAPSGVSLDIDKMIALMLSSTSPASRSNIALLVCEKISNMLESDSQNDDLLIQHLTKCLSVIQLPEGDTAQVKVISVLKKAQETAEMKMSRVRSLEGLVSFLNGYARKIQKSPKSKNCGSKNEEKTDVEPHLEA